jgi:hypothetical protein
MTEGHGRSSFQGLVGRKYIIVNNLDYTKGFLDKKDLQIVLFVKLVTLKNKVSGAPPTLFL